jgi:signal transduction histidine kinase
VLRQASVALGGRPVTFWEVSAKAELDPRLSSHPHPAHHATHLDVDSTLRRWGIPILQGSGWVGCRIGAEGPWVIAPARLRPPAPPPGGQERRSPERLTLELAGLCLGLMDRPDQPAAPAGPGPTRDLTSLPAVMAHELGNRLTTARAALQMAIESLGRWTDVAASRRLELLDDLGQVLEDIDRGTQFVRAVRDRARGALARWERFDAMRVLQSCCTLEGRVLRDRTAVEFRGAVDPIYLLGDPNALYDALVNLIRNAADAAKGAASETIIVAAERGGASLRVSVRDRGVGISARDLDHIFDPGFTTKDFGEGAGMGLALVQDVVRNRFGGSVAVETAVGVGTTVTLTLPIPPQRTVDPQAPRRESAASEVA